MIALLAQAAEGPGRSAVLDLLAILAAAAGAILVLRRLGLAAIPGYLVTGALIGPHALGLISSDANIHEISDLATILLMFTIGLHLDLSGLRRGGLAPILGIGVASTLGAAVLGWPLAMLFGLPAPAALAASMALSMSSTAVVLRMLQERRQMQQVHGRITFGVLIVQDLIALAFLAALPALASWQGLRGGGGAEASAMPAVERGAEMIRVGVAAARAVGGIALLILFGLVVLPRLLREATRGGGGTGGGGEALLVLSAAVALAAAVLTGWLGFSPELGAFLAGFMLAGTPFRHQLSGQLAPMRDLFMAVFFTAVGLWLDSGAMVESWWVVLLGLGAMLALKAAVTGGVVWGVGASPSVGVFVGLLLAQAGEFSLVLLKAAGSRGLVPDRAEAVLIAIVVLSLIVTPWLYSLGVALRRRTTGWRTAPWIGASVLAGPAGGPGAGGGKAEVNEGEVPGGEGPAGASLARYAVIAGFGVVGRTLADHFEVEGIPFTIIDLNATTIATQRRLGRRAVYGDVTNAEVLESAGVREADAVMVTIPDDEAMLKACRVIRSMAPGAFIAARTDFLSKAMIAAEYGADHVVVEEVATAEAMERQVLAKLRRRAEDRAAAGSGQSGNITPA